MNRNIFKNNYAYLFWLLFYIILFGIPTGFIIVPFYIIAFLFALSGVSESFWRVISGVRPLRLNLEKERLLPLFEAVYSEAAKTDKTLFNKNINLYIHESMDINAFAFGKQTLALTRGSIELLDDECLKGLIAHELGHFSNGDTVVTLFANVGNFPLSLLVKFLSRNKEKFEKADKLSLVTIVFKNLNELIFLVVKIIQFLGDLIIMRTRRINEHRADYFALKCGFGIPLTEALIEIYSVSITTPQSVKELFKSTHPHITKRIERLENKL